MRVPVFFAMVGKASPASARSLWSVSLPYWGMAMAAGGLVWLWRRTAPDLHPLSGLAVAGLIAGTAYLGMLYLTPSGRDLFHDMRRIVKELLPAKQTSGSSGMSPAV
jgi:hypothetical protein